MEKVIARIQKLLSLATSDNEHEAKIAMDQANELLVKHNLSMQQAQRSLDYQKDLLKQAKRAALEDKFIMPILVEHFFVKVVKSRRGDMMIDGQRQTSYYILGTEVNVQIATYVYGYLSRTFKTLYQDYCATNGKRSSRKSYYYGLMAGLSTQLEASRAKAEQQAGLVVAEDPALRDYVDDAFDNLKYKNTRLGVDDPEAAQAGEDQGQKIRISRGIESKGDDGKLLR